MKKLLFIFVLLVTYAFGALNLQTASEAELMSIKGIGVKRAAAIIQYRKTHKIKDANDLKNIKGIDTQIVSNVENDVRNKSRKKVNANKKRTYKRDNTNLSKIKKDKAEKKLKDKKDRAEKKQKNKKEKAKKKLKEKKEKAAKK